MRGVGKDRDRKRGKERATEGRVILERKCVSVHQKKAHTSSP